MSNLNINKSILGGRLTSDVELKTTSSGISVCSFTIAATRKANRNETDFINCVAWRKAAELVSQYFRKGSSICVAGSIQTRNWEDGKGNKRTATELVVDEVYFVDSKSDNEQPVVKKQKEEVQFEEMTADEDLPF